MVPVSLVITLLAVLLSPILPIFSTNEYGWLDNGSKEGFGPRLPKWLSWFQTPDNSLDGDATFESLNPPSYLSKTKWIIRNPGYGYGVKYLDAPFTTQYWGDNTIKDNDNAKEGCLFVKANGLFQYVYIKQIASTDRCVYINLGWNIRALVDPNATIRNPYEATFSFSPRISGYR
jgi:hypothetical protein